MRIVRKSLIPELFERIDGKIALRSGIAASLAWFAAGTFSELLPHANPTISSLWCVLTTLLVLQAHLGGTYRAAWQRFLGLAVGTIIGAVLATYFGADALTLGISITATVVICSLFNLQEAFRIAVSTVAVIMILLPITPQNTPWQFSLYRFMDSCLGILVAVFVAHTILPYKAVRRMRLNLSDAMRDIGRLYRLIAFTNEPNENQRRATLLLIKEVDTILFRTRQTLDDSKAELITKSSRVEDWTMLITHMDDLFEQVLSMRHAYRPDTKKIFDSELSHQLESIIEKISISFQDISMMLETGVWTHALPDLNQSLTELKEELIRFRSRSGVKDFNLEDVESFFVFFYNLKSILQILRKIEMTIHSLITEKTF